MPNSGNPTTTMNDLLTAIKYNILRGQSTTFSTVKTYKKGILPPIPVFPAITITPEREFPFKFYSNKAYKVVRKIRLDVYGKGYDLKNCHIHTIELIKSLKDLAISFYRWPDSGGTDQCYNTEMESEILGEPIPYKNRYIQKCSLTINCYSWEALPDQDFADTSTEESADDFLSTVYDKVSSYKNTTLAKVKTIVKGVTPPIPVYPAIVVAENIETNIHYEAGRDRLDREFEVVVYHKLLDKEGILTRVINEVENLKTIIHTNPRWDGKSVWTRITDITYGMYIDENSHLYSAVISFTSEAKKRLVVPIYGANINSTSRLQSSIIKSVPSTVRYFSSTTKDIESTSRSISVGTKGIKSYAKLSWPFSINATAMLVYIIPNINSGYVDVYDSYTKSINSTVKFWGIMTSSMGGYTEITT
jgi:hypothetical protein